MKNWTYSASQWISFLQNSFKWWTIVNRVLFQINCSFHYRFNRIIIIKKFLENLTDSNVKPSRIIETGKVVSIVPRNIIII